MRRIFQVTTQLKILNFYFFKKYRRLEINWFFKAYDCRICWWEPIFTFKFGHQISIWVKLIASSSDRCSYPAVISLVLGDAVIFQIGVVGRFPILSSYEDSWTFDLILKLEKFVIYSNKYLSCLSPQNLPPYYSQ